MEKKLEVLVVGATGNQGGSVAKHLLTKGYRVRTLSRNPDSDKAKALAVNGVEIIKGDFSNSDTLQKALDGVDTIYAMTTPFEKGVEAETQQGLDIIEAAKKASVGHFVFGSVASADEGTGIPHFDSKFIVEEALKTSGLSYTISAPVYFMDNLLTPWFLPSLKKGALALGMPGDVKLQQVSVDNIGEFVAELVKRRDKVFARRFDFAGDELTGEEAAKILTEASGKKIKYQGFPPDMLRKDSEDMALMYEWFISKGYDADIKKIRTDFPQVKWQSYKDWANSQDWSAL